MSPQEFQDGFGSLPRLAADIHLELVAVEKAQALVDVADSNAAPVHLDEPLRRDAHAVVFYFDEQAPVTAVRAQVNLPALQARRQAMLDGILDDRLQKHARNETPRAFPRPFP